MLIERVKTALTNWLRWPTPAIAVLLFAPALCSGEMTKRLRTSDAVNNRLNLRQSEIVSPEFGFVTTASGDAALAASLTIEGTPLAISLKEHSNRSDRYELVVQVEQGELVELEPGPVRTYRGEIEGLDGSAVAATLADDGLHAVIIFPDDTKYWLEPLAGVVAGADAERYALYRDDDVLRTDLACQEIHPPLDEGALLAPNTADAEGSTAGGLFITELAIDADVEYYLDYGSVSTVETQINNIVNSVNIQYERDLNIRHVITRIIVRTAEPDPYSQTVASGLLDQLRSHWNSQQFTVQRDVTQLFTGKQLDDSTIGVAYVGGTSSNTVCGSFGYSVVESNCQFSCSSFAAKTDLSAHELGHNWGADHCACPGWTMNPTITAANRFHPTFDIPEMSAFRDTRHCLNTDDELRRLTITAASPTVPEGGYVQITAIADFRYGPDENVTAFVDWLVDGEFGRIFSNGLYNAYYVNGDVCTNIMGSFTYQNMTRSDDVSIRIVDPDAPLAIEATLPPDGAIDARQPSDTAATVAFGWDTLTVTLNGQVCSASPTDFTVTEQNGSAPIPSVSDVLQLSPSSYQLTLNHILEPGTWTVVTHTASGSSVTLGFLPGDVNGNRVSNTDDVAALVSALDGNPNALPPWSTDLDLSGELTPADLITLVDLLNGADAFIDWDGFKLP